MKKNIRIVALGIIILYFLGTPKSILSNKISFYRLDTCYSNVKKKTESKHRIHEIGGTNLYFEGIEELVEAINHKNDTLCQKKNKCVSDTIFIKQIESKTDTLNVKIKNEKDSTFFLSTIPYISTLISLILFYISCRQFKVIILNEKSFLAGVSYIEIVNPAYTQNTIDLLQHGANLYLDLTNASKNAITDIWIKFPDSLSLNLVIIGNTENRPIKYANINEVILPEKKMIVLFDKTFLFNQMTINNIESYFTVKYKGIKEKRYKTISIPFSIKVQKIDVKHDYKLSTFNTVTVNNGLLKPYDENDWNNIK